MDFIEALERKDISQIERIPKSDIHNHAGRGGNRVFLQERTGKSLPLPPEKFDSLEHMQEWYSSNIKPACQGLIGMMLQVAPSYASHPIQRLFREGIPVTINTDDLLIFNQPVSMEYLNLYQAGTLTAIELDEIRRIGLDEKNKHYM